MNRIIMPWVSRSIQGANSIFKKVPVRTFLAAAILLTIPVGRAFAAADEPGPEDYKLKLDGAFWYTTPGGTLGGGVTTTGEGGVEPAQDISVSKNLHFEDYATFFAGVDWHFKRKHHLTFVASPNQTSKTAILQQDITFRGFTFEEGSSANAQLRNFSFAPGYEYDVIHRKHGHLAIIAQLNLLDIKATIKGTAFTSDGTAQATASGSVFAPLPVFGPEARVYFLHDRLHAEGFIKGMYFFGYGNYLSTEGTLGVRVTSHIDAVAGYALGSRLVIDGTSTGANGNSGRLDVHLTQKGPTVGASFTF